jgi:hypothetical protein
MGLPGVGPKNAQLLVDKGLRTVRDIEQARAHTATHNAFAFASRDEGRKP